MAALAAGRGALWPAASQRGIAAGSVRARRPHRREKLGRGGAAAAELVVREHVYFQRLYVNNK